MTIVRKEQVESQFVKEYKSIIIVFPSTIGAEKICIMEYAWSQVVIRLWFLLRIIVDQEKFLVSLFSKTIGVADLFWYCTVSNQYLTPLGIKITTYILSIVGYLWACTTETTTWRIPTRTAAPLPNSRQ